MARIFVTGISTEVGKTVASAIITQSLEADYWKPIQSGDLDYSDTHKVKALVSNEKTVFHENAYALNTPASPHLSAELDGITINIDSIQPPKTKNHLVIEGAGGLLVPLNSTQTLADIIQPDYKVILVSRHYLGSINHTLLTIEALRSRNLQVSGIIFSGNEHASTETWLLENTQIPCIGRIEVEPYFDQNVVAEYADLFHDNLLSVIR